MFRTSKQEILADFGFDRDPFKKTFVESTDYKRINKVVGMAVNDRAMVAVVGERGIGKSYAVRSTLRKIRDVRLVCPLANDINKLLIGDIEQALILDLGNEKPKRGREIRARQLRRILGEASTRKAVVLVIEEAHHLHGLTLRSLKRIREMEWMGNAELLSIILVGQSDPLNKPGVSEVRLRADSIHMRGLSQEEIRAFIGHSTSHVFDQKAVDVISKLPNAHNYEDLKTILFQLMEHALFSGRKEVTVEDIKSVFADKDLMDIYREAGMETRLRRTGKKEKKAAEKDQTGQLTGFLKDHQKDSSSVSQKVVNG